MIAASHPYQVSISNGYKITWLFENILLPDSISDENASHGFLSYKVKAKGSVVGGEVINNTAAIYFDYNQPIATNIEKNDTGCARGVTY